MALLHVILAGIWRRNPSEKSLELTRPNPTVTYYTSARASEALTYLIWRPIHGRSSFLVMGTCAFLTIGHRLLRTMVYHASTDYPSSPSPHSPPTPQPIPM
ncbi:hypothetical protein IAS59_002693 [Cryptococcus gattii]